MKIIDEKERCDLRFVGMRCSNNKKRGKVCSALLSLAKKKANLLDFIIKIGT